MNLLDYNEFDNLKNESSNEVKLDIAIDNLSHSRTIEIRPTIVGYSRMTDIAKDIIPILDKLRLNSDNISEFMFDDEQVFNSLKRELIKNGLLDSEQKTSDSSNIIGIINLRNRNPKLNFQINITSQKDLVSFIILKKFFHEDKIESFLTIYYPDLHDIYFNEI